MYEVEFHTNLDCPRGTWSFPKKVLTIPEIGHHVESLNGPILKVCRVTHTWRDGFSSSESKPVIKIELTKENW